MKKFKYVIPAVYFVLFEGIFWTLGVQFFNFIYFIIFEWKSIGYGKLDFLKFFFGFLGVLISIFFFSLFIKTISSCIKEKDE